MAHLMMSSSVVLLGIRNFLAFRYFLAALLSAYLQCCHLKNCSGSFEDMIMKQSAVGADDGSPQRQLKLLSYAADTMQVCREKHLDRDTRRDGRDGLGVESLVLITLTVARSMNTLVISLFYSVRLPPFTTMCCSELYFTADRKTS